MKELFSEEDKRERYVDLSIAALNFQAEFKAKRKADAIIDFSIIYSVIVAACDDIARYKLYHLKKPFSKETRSDEIKRAAYYSKWILKFRPFSIPLDATYDAEDLIKAAAENKDLVLINELFALRIGLANVSIKASQNLILSPAKMNDFLYTFHFHNLTDDKILMMYQTLYDISQDDDFFV